MSEPSVVDFLGKAIKLGDTIVYPVRRRSVMSLKKATVCEEPNNETYILMKGLMCLNENGRRVVLRNPERCVVVETLEERHGNLESH